MLNDYLFLLNSFASIAKYLLPDIQHINVSGNGFVFVHANTSKFLTDFVAFSQYFYSLQYNLEHVRSKCFK